MEWAEFVAWAIFIFFMSIVFPIVLVTTILCITFRRQGHIRTVPSSNIKVLSNNLELFTNLYIPAPYVIDQTDRQTEPPYPGFVIHPSYSNNSIHRSSSNELSVNIETRDVPPPYSSIHGSQFPGLQTQLPYPEHNAAHFPNPSTGRRVRFSIDKPLIFGIGNVYLILYTVTKCCENKKQILLIAFD